MADLPTKKVSINIGVYYVTYESDSNSPAAGQILSVEKNNVLLDPASAEFLTVVNDETTQITLQNSLKVVNKDLYKTIFGAL